jgi:Flp pilus assembly protein TadD
MEIAMKRLIILLLVSCLAGCAAVVPPPGEKFLRDAAFAPPSAPIRTDIFALNPAMRAYLANDMAGPVYRKGAAQGLYDALYSKRQLQLDYDAAITRTAAEAFDARRGNCLSLVIMTAAFAKELGLDVRFTSVMVDELWSRSGDLFLTTGHVNITLARPHQNPMVRFADNVSLTIDFFPLSSDLTRGYSINEATIAAMYFNNRAAETLAAGRVSDAYWWAREAVLRDREFMPALNTLGVVYRRHGDSLSAEAAFRQVLARESWNVQAMSNLRLVLQDQGRTAEAEQIALKLAKVQPYPPYFFFDQGQAALREQNFLKARDLFAREIRRQPYNADFHIGMAAAYVGLGDYKTAEKHYVIAYDTSSTRKQQNQLAAKLEKVHALAHPAGTR